MYSETRRSPGVPATCGSDVTFRRCAPQRCELTELMSFSSQGRSTSKDLVVKPSGVFRDSSAARPSYPATTATTATTATKDTTLADAASHPGILNRSGSGRKV